MRIEDVRLAIDLCMKARVTPFLWGRHGIGKSTAVRDLCYMNDWGFVDERLSQCEAADLRGLPAKDEVTKTTVFYAPAQFPRGDMTIDQIVSQLAAALGTEVPKKKDGGLTPLQQLRTAAEAGRYAKDGEGVEFDGAEIPYENLRQFRVLLKQLQPRFPHGVFFLDEFNRSEDDVLQCSFELVLDRSIGMHVLPPGWGVVAAGNYTEGYSVNPMMRELALSDRFCHFDLMFDIEDWARWVNERFTGSAQRIVEFGMQNTEHVTGKIDVKNDVAIQPSPRAWEMVARVLVVAEKESYPAHVVEGCIAGLIGSGLAVKFMKYRCPVEARDIVEKGIKGLEKKLKGIVDDSHARGVMGGLVFGVLSHAQSRLNETTVIHNLFDFAEFLAKTPTMHDLAVAFMRPIICAKSDGTIGEDNSRAALLSNDRLAALVSMHKGSRGKLRVIDEFNKRADLKKLMKDVTWGNE